MSTSTTPTLSRLTRVDLRTAWMSESGDFTPWLAKAENLQLLAETLDIDLELEAQEKSVGPFRADILCKETGTEHWVLIENQLERTDHGHLGQLITYAAGLKAATIVWISSRFTEEHRAALDWLNEITASQFNFFGVEIELWQIDNSPVAPKFNIVCQPNDWSKSVSDSVERGELTEAKQSQIEFWTILHEYLAEHSKLIRPTKPLPANWITFSIGRSGFQLCAVTSIYNAAGKIDGPGHLRAELLIQNDTSKACFEKLFQEKDAIESDAGEPLIWHAKPGTKQCKVYVTRSADITDPATWPDQVAWLAQKLEMLHRVFAARVKGLVVEPVNGKSAILG